MFCTESRPTQRHIQWIIRCLTLLCYLHIISIEKALPIDGQPSKLDEVIADLWTGSGGYFFFACMYRDKMPMIIMQIMYRSLRVIAVILHPSSYGFARGKTILGG